MIVEVTQANIDEGVAGSCGGCPIALAIDDDVLVRPAYVIRFHDGGWQFANLPREAKGFIQAFDRNIHVRPIEFVLVWGDH